MKKFFALLLMAAMIFSLAACGSGNEQPSSGTTPAENNTNAPAATQPEAAEKVFVSPAAYIPETFYTGYFSDTRTTLTRGLWEPLFYVYNGKTEYYLIDNITKSDDGLTYTFHMNEKATWSDGEPITTDDVFFTFDVCDVWDDIYSGGFMKVDGEKITYTQVDKATFTAVLPAPNGNYLRDFSLYCKLLPKHAFNGDPTAAIESPLFESTDIVTSGAFKLSEVNEDSFILTARDDYYRGKPGVDKLVYRLLGNGVSNAVAFDNGDLSWMRITDASDYNKYVNNSDYNIVSIPEDKFTYLLFNRVNFGDRLTEDARKAICMALNVDEIVQGAYGSTVLAQPATSVICPSFSIYEPMEGYHQNIEEAKQLAEACGLTKITLNYAYSNEAPNTEQIATMVQAQLSKIGVTVNIKGYDYSTFSDLEYAETDEWDMLTNGVDSMRGDGLPDVGFLTNAWTDSGWTDEVMSLAKQVNVETDMAKAKELAKQLHEATLNNYVCYPLTYGNFVAVTRSNITGLDASNIVPEFTDISKITVK